MTARDLLNRLTSAVCEDDWRRLEENDPSLVVSRWNRATLLRMREYLAGDFDVDDAQVEALKAALQSYLNRYMEKQPEGHRWIMLSCLFLAFVAREPLHPGEVVHHRKIVEGGRIVYRCPAREDSPGSLCRFCVCRHTTEREN